MAFFVFVKMGKAQLSRALREIKQFYTLYFLRQNVVRTSVTHSAIASCATFLFLPHFDVICDLLLDRCTATWNLFVKQIANEARSAELAIIISYPTSSSGIIVSLKTLHNCRKLDRNGNKNATKIVAYVYHICRAWYNGSYTIAAKPIKTLELHHTMVQFLINKQ